MIDCALKMSSSITLAIQSSFPTSFSPLIKNSWFNSKPFFAASHNGAVSSSCWQLAASSALGDVHKQRSRFESLFCYDKAIPEEIIEKPIGLSLADKEIGDNPRCADCQAKGAVLCVTCSGSGLYVDSILESQGIIVKVRCLGCGGTGNIMCSECGGRGHIGLA